MTYMISTLDVVLCVVQNKTMCQRKSLVLEKIAGSQWSCSNRRRNITYWSYFYISCNSEFSYFWLVFDFLQPRLLRLTTPAYTVTFGFASAQLAQSVMQQQLANHFLLRRLIILRNESYYWLIFDSSQGLLTLDKVGSIDNEHLPKSRPWAHPLYENVDPTIIKQQNFIGKCSESTKPPPPVQDFRCHRMDETKGFGRTGKSRLTKAIGSCNVALVRCCFELELGIKFVTCN